MELDLKSDGKSKSGAKKKTPANKSRGSEPEGKGGPPRGSGGGKRKR